jgi:NAD(P)-dependent dehydrogenase (short-subunit alcohol dehydrogenase family)
MPNNFRTKNKKVLIIGVTSGIGEELARLFLKNNAMVSGTYRNKLDAETIDHEIDSYCLDLANRDSLEKLCADLKAINYQWDILIVSVATLEPIGSFLSVDFDEWKHSFDVNYFGQLELLHSLHKFHAKNATVVFFTGGAPNGVLEKYSAYSVAKIGLTKMVEYLDHEDSNVKYTIIGPGWVNTKIHKQTLHANDKAGNNLERTEKFLDNESEGTPMLDIYNCIDWLVEKPKDLVGGRNFSVVWDDWGTRSGNTILNEQLENNTDLYKLRRREPVVLK